MANPRKNNTSLLLNSDENNVVISNIGLESSTSCIGVVQFYTTVPPNHDNWVYKGSGAIALIRDASRKSYFIRFLSLDGGNVDMEQELYKTIVLHKNGNLFLSFEAQGCIWGLLFCEKSELNLLESEILSKIKPKSSSSIEKNSSVQLKSTVKKSSKSIKSVNERSMTVSVEKKEKKKKEKTAKKGKKEVKPRPEISGPSNFIVVAHVGYDGVTGLENMQDSDKWKDLIKFVYGTTSEITQEETSHLMDLVTKNGGIEKYADAIEKTKKKKDTPTKKSKQPKTTLPTSAPSKPVPPVSKSPAPPPPKAVAAPPPPPPPSTPPPPMAKASAPPTRSIAPSLQDQIQKGAVLKKVEITESSEEEAEGLLGALVNNLSAFRQKVKASSSDESSDVSGDDSDDDW